MQWMNSFFVMVLFKRLGSFLLFFAIFFPCWVVHTELSAQPLAQSLTQPSTQSALLTMLQTPGHSMVVQNIVIQGLAHFSRDTVMNCFPSSPHRSYDVATLNRCYHALESTGLFSHIAFHMQGTTLVVQVTENQFIRHIHLDNMDQRVRRELAKLLMPIVRERQVLSHSRIEKARYAILSYFQAKGAFGTTVKAEYLYQKNGMVDLVFTVSNGGIARIASIHFQGNAGISSLDLSAAIKSYEARFWRFWGPVEQCYSQERVYAQDVEALQKFYRNRGFLEVKVAPHAQVANNGRDVNLIFSISEGPQYCFGTTRIESEFPSIDTTFIQKIIPWTAGKPLNLMGVKQTCKNIEGRLIAMGYPFIAVVPDILPTPSSPLPRQPKAGPGSLWKRNPVRDSMHPARVILRLRRMPATYAQRIVIRGNYKTEESVIRRYLAFSNGDPINARLVDASENMLRATQFFKDVNLEILPGTYPEDPYRTCLIKITEDNQLQGWAGGGIGTDLGLFLRGTLTQKNFLGKGWGQSFVAEGGTKGWMVSSNLIMPSFQELPLTVSLNLNLTNFKGRTRPRHVDESLSPSNSTGPKKGSSLPDLANDLFDADGDEESTYRQQVWGVGASGRYNLTPSIAQEIGYNINRSFLRLGQGRVVSRYILDNIAAVPVVWSSTLSHALSYSGSRCVDGLVRAGWFAKMSNKYTGLGGNAHFFFNNLGLGAFYAFGPEANYLLRLDVGYGVLSPIGYMGFNNLLFLGGYSFPGFDESGIGPRDTITRDSLGGKQYYTASAKFYIPVDLPFQVFKESPLKFVTFVQSGSLWSPLFKGPNIGSSDMTNRVSAGAGLVWNMPYVGNLSLIVATTLQKDPLDTPRKVLFMGTAF